ILGAHPRGSAVALDVNASGGMAALDALIAQSDVVISLLPYVFHLDVARKCLAHKRHLVTTSYVKPEMQALDGAAKEAGLLFLNELGLDPGIDHMSAMRVIEAVKDGGGTVVSFRSYCGGLPSPDDNDNPLGYKFSWSPKGVVLAGTNSAKFIEDGHLKEIPNTRLFATHWPVFAAGVGELEGYPNRDSVSYIETYGLHGVHTMFRGTLRNLGWCATWQKLVELGIVNPTPRADLHTFTFGSLVGEMAGRMPGEDARGAVARFLALHPQSLEMNNIAWMGLLDNRPIPRGAESLADALAMRLAEMMPYRKGEKDMIVLLHEFLVSYPGRSALRRITSTLVACGEPEGDSAMSKTVSLPAAVGTKLLLDGHIRLTGVHIPVVRELYEPILDELKGLRIECVEEWED
ncbi:saccharopine dehydrogenase NADP-binding domain-containing protein, partial [Candidatus Fermentibacteria bacterium]|nr:saccharopine dehydrogenase NADP-binding domain-containing protein [Candidatus Fermentibacteria bacterium]